MKYMDWAAMGAASSAYAEASRARSENEELWRQNQSLNYELHRLQINMDELQDDVSRRRSMEEYQAWIEEFIYKFNKAVTNISSDSTDPINDYGVIASFLDIINKNSLDTSRIRGLENKSAFEETFCKARNLFDQLEESPEVQSYLHKQEETLLEQEQFRAEAQKEARQSVQTQRPTLFSEAKKWFGRDKDPEDKYNIGVSYFNGQGVKQDYSKALKYFRLAADQGHAVAQYNLGCMYRDSCGVKQDYSEAMQWFLLAAGQGLIQAQYNLGCMYDRGQGVKQDYSKALKWYLLAADRGHSDAQYCLGAMYHGGQGVREDYSEALKWYRLAADQGHAMAQYNLGAMYHIGQGVKQDYSKALKYFRLAADQGFQEAKDLLQKLQ